MTVRSLVAMNVLRKQTSRYVYDVITVSEEHVLSLRTPHCPIGNALDKE
jgi:hypothetical protein